MKPHIANSSDPLKEGSTLTAVCGEDVPHAKFIAFWDNQELPEFLSVSMARFCRNCCKAPLDEIYVYLVVNGESTLHPEDEKELEAVA